MRMRVELEFMDLDENIVHEKEMIYNDFSAPVPSVGDKVHIEGYSYKVVDRDFIYLQRSHVDLKITFWCEKLNKE
jgi:hypothetical protein